MAKRFANQLGPIWVYNEHKGVIAICLSKDFEDELKGWWAVTTVGFNPKEFDVRQVALAPCQLEIDPTFTFAGDAERIRPHTGNIADAEALRSSLVKKVTGCNEKLLPKGVVSLLVRRDPRLVVPFGKVANNEDALRQLRVHGNHTVEQAKSSLLPK